MEALSRHITNQKQAVIATIALGLYNFNILGLFLWLQKWDLVSHSIRSHTGTAGKGIENLRKR